MGVRRQVSIKKISVLFIIISLLLFLLFASGCCSLREWRHAPLSVDDEKTIFVVSHGWHTGIVVAQSDIDPDLSFLRTYFAESAFYELGWGDRGFYQAEKITTGLALRAVFWPTDSVMHVVGLPEAPNTYFPAAKVVEMKVSSKGHALLNKALAQSFNRDENGEVVRLQNGLYGDSLFFAGKGTYYLTNTCNTWTARVLGAAGAPVESFLTLTADGVMKQVEQAVAEPPGQRP